MLFRRAAFGAAGGFDQRDLQVAFNDVDLCLKVGIKGFRVVWTPASTAEHRESLSRGDDLRPDQQARFFQEHETMATRWHLFIAEDRSYHRAFSKRTGILTDLGDVIRGGFPGAHAAHVDADGPAHNSTKDLK
jgi:GT2 family glycosyltransferase